jgi:glycine hydroxymethyltransferase
MHVIAAKAVALGEALRPDFRSYGEQVVRNAKAMAEAFVERGYHLVSGGTDNHLMLIDLSNKGLTGKDAEAALQAADITVNKNMVPFDTQSPFVTSGIRVGTPAMTTRGLGVEEFRHVVEMMDRILTNPTNEDVQKEIRGEVAEICQAFPLYDFIVAGEERIS